MRLLALLRWTQAEPFGVPLWELQEPADGIDQGDAARHVVDAIEQLHQCMQAAGRDQDGPRNLSLLVRVVPRLLENAEVLACGKVALAAIGNCGNQIRAVQLYVPYAVRNHPERIGIGDLLPRAQHLHIEGCDPEGAHGDGDATIGFAVASQSPLRATVTSLELHAAGTGFTRQLGGLHAFPSLRSLLVSRANNIEPPWNGDGQLTTLQSVALHDIPALRTLHSWCAADWQQAAPALREIRLVRVKMAQMAPDIEFNAGQGALALHVGPDVRFTEGSNVEAHIHRTALTKKVEHAVAEGGVFDATGLAPELQALFAPFDARYLLSHQPEREGGQHVARSLVLDCAGLQLDRWRLVDWLPESPSTELGQLTIGLEGARIGSWLPAFVARIAAGWRPWQPDSPRIRLTVRRPPSRADRAYLLAAAAIGVEVLRMGTPMHAVHAVEPVNGQERVRVTLHVTDGVSCDAAERLVLDVMPMEIVTEIQAEIGDGAFAEGLCSALLKPRDVGCPLDYMTVQGDMRTADVTSIIAALHSRALLQCDLREANFDMEALLHVSRRPEIYGTPPRLALSRGHFEQMIGVEAARTAFFLELKAALAPTSLDRGQH